MQHYSQKNEQEAIIQAIEGLPAGRFLDIGAYDGESYSNTRALLDLNWGGVMVEAGLDAFQKLLAKHGGSPKVALIHAAIGPVDELKPFWNCATTFSTSEQGNYNKFIHEGFSQKYFVPVLSVVELLRYLQPMIPFDVVSIDTEGTSTDIFQQLVKRVQPKVVCVEHDNRKETWEIGAQAGYRVLMQNEENIVFGR